jgi:hypothetical protein
LGNDFIANGEEYVMSIDINDIAFTTEQRWQLAKLSESTGKSPSELLDQMLAQYHLPAAAENGGGRTLYDAFAEDGSIGMVKGGPSDMSTNPKYMEGFGGSGR